MQCVILAEKYLIFNEVYFSQKQGHDYTSRG